MLENGFAGFHEHGYRVTWSLSRSEIEQVHALRADVFCRELGWVGTTDDRVEHDEFDATSVHVAVVDEGSNVVAAVRLTGGDERWMLDSVFRRLAGPELVEKRADTAEASRLVVARRSRATRLPDGRRTCDIVYKGAYAYSVSNGIRHVYMVTSDVVLRHMLGTGLPCVALAAPTRMPDGVNALAVKLEWAQLSRAPALASWYRSGWEWRPEASPQTHAPPVRRLRHPTRTRIRSSPIAGASSACITGGVGRAAVSGENADAHRLRNRV